MPFSNGEHDNKCLDLVEDFFDKKDIKFLDIGPGAGKWYEKTSKRFPQSTIEACEVFPKYVEQYELEKKYKQVHISSVVDFEWEEGEYDVVIMGDVLEHLTIDDAKAVLEKIKEKKALGIIQVPWVSPQDEYEGNVYEIHIQPDLNPEVMSDRYPELEYIVCDKTTGAYYLPPEPRAVKSVRLAHVKDLKDFGAVFGRWMKEERDSTDLHVCTSSWNINCVHAVVGVQFLEKESIEESNFMSWNGIELTLPKVINPAKYENIIE